MSMHSSSNNHPIQADDRAFGARDTKTAVIARMIREYRPIDRGRVLVVGCGTGIEAAILARALNSKVIGIDLTAQFDAHAATLAELRVADATRLEFSDGSFDLVYSFHALEHIPDYRRALREMQRVLVAGGSFFIGTPNRSRIAGYIGSDNVSIGTKIKWNLVDWRARLRGRFRNEFGAHAGYTAAELEWELRQVFSTVQNVTFRYYALLYARHVRKLQITRAAGISNLLFPAVYFQGLK